jgi:cell division GTPase FtsZ
VTVLLLSTGGGGGNILRSLKALFRRDLTVAQGADPKYAERLRRAITTRFLDTNEFSLSAVPKEERVIIGAATTGGLGARHNPEIAAQALEESKAEVQQLLSEHSVIVIIGTGGKGTGAGTTFPLAQMARQQKKLVIPIFVLPSFERHEVEKRRYDHALHVAGQFDSAGIRLMEILNDRGYADADPQPQSVVWERMNLPIARGLRGLLYVLWDLSQVDPSDLSILFAGPGRLRIGFSELNPPAGQEPDDDEISAAVRACWENPYCAFDEAPGTSLVCIQGDWSNVVDGKIKAELAARALGGAREGPYNPLYARAARVPRPWGLTTLLSEYTGTHQPLDVDWSAERKASLRAGLHAEAEAVRGEPTTPARQPVPAARAIKAPAPAPAPAPAFASFWDFALAINRSDAAALEQAANGLQPDIPIDVGELRKLLSTFWFRSVFSRLSPAWRDRMLAVLVEQVAIPNYTIKTGRRTVRLSELTDAQRRQMLNTANLPDAIRADFQLVVAVAMLWGDDAVKRFTLTPASDAPGASALSSLLQSFRQS